MKTKKKEEKIKIIEWGIRCKNKMTWKITLGKWEFLNPCCTLILYIFFVMQKKQKVSFCSFPCLVNLFYFYFLFSFTFYIIFSIFFFAFFFSSENVSIFENEWKMNFTIMFSKKNKLIAGLIYLYKWDVVMMPVKIGCMLR